MMLCGLCSIGVPGCYRREPVDLSIYEDTEVADSGEPAECIPQEELPLRPDAPSAYADMCEPHLGVVPTVDCSEGEQILVTVDGIEIFEDPGPWGCDNPRAGNCEPGSSLRRHEAHDADGTPRPEVVWVSLCRHDEQKDIPENHVQIIGYNYDTGATCFFGSGDVTAWTRTDETSRLIGQLPGPDDPGFDIAFEVPDNGEKLCVSCHQSNPFIHTGWIDSAILDEETGETVVPSIAGLHTPYYVIGAPEWDMRTLYIEGNECLDCHRVGMETVRLLSDDPWYVQEEMPPEAPGVLNDDYDALADCWLQGSKNTPGCDWIVPPGGGCDLRIVGDEYPNQSDMYNQGGELPAPPR
jgi:hypothetical protein